ncbi:MAG TPA: hypothetical protein VGD67_07425 [Pseudonocardiaceae bacterium]
MKARGGGYAVLYLLALIGAVTVAAVLWAAVGNRHRPGHAPRIIPPDDDPDFLRRLGERRDDD